MTETGTQQKPELPPIAECPANTVQLFQFPRGPFAPSMSPLPIKVETYLRLAEIPYQNDLYGRLSEKTHKIPWIRYNGEEIADSALILDFLVENKIGRDLDEDLTTEQKAVSLAFERLVDEHLYWILLIARWKNDSGFEMNKIGFGEEMANQVRPYLIQSAHSQGMGRHSNDVVMEFGKKTFKAFSDYLGDKDYLMGDKPTRVDCAVFATFAQCVWQLQDSWMDLVIPECFPNLERYCHRIKDSVWPDWEDCITHGGTKEATK